MTENEVETAELATEEEARLRLEPPDSFHADWQWANDGEGPHHVVVRLLDDGSVEIEHVVDGQLGYTYMRHRAPERLDPDPVRMAAIRTFLGLATIEMKAGGAPPAVEHYAADVRWLLHELDKAAARDRQPYPTRQAYERAAEVLNFYRGKVQRLRQHLDSRFSQPTLSEIRRVLDGDGINPPPSANSMGSNLGLANTEENTP